MQREEERSEEGMRDLINKIKHKENKNERRWMGGSCLAFVLFTLLSLLSLIVIE